MTFDEYTAREAHQQEIADTRVGYLGGSDAHIAYRVCEVGIQGLSATDTDRLKVAFGLTEEKKWGGNKYTDRGHAFEEYMEKLFDTMGQEVEREWVMKGDTYQHFSVLAHADFYDPETKTVYECKCVVGKTTAKVEAQYYAQLQWYYMLGAEKVVLVHGTDEVTCMEMSVVERNDGYIDIMKQGLRTIDEGYKILTSVADKITETDDTIDSVACVLLRQYRDLQIKIDQLTKESNELRGKIAQYMNNKHLTNINAEDVECRITAKTQVRTLDSKKVLAAYPDIANGDYYRVTERKGGVVITCHKNNE